MRHHCSYENILLCLIKGSVFPIPFLVFYVSWNLPFPFVTGRNFLFRFLVELSFSCWLGLIALRKRYLPSPNNPLLWALSVFLLISGLADVVGLNPYRSFWGNYERMEGYLSLLHLGAFFIVLTGVLGEKDWKTLLNCFLIAGLMTTLYTLLARFGLLPLFPGGTSRLGGNLGNPNFLATYLLFTGGIGVFLLFAASSRWMWLFYGPAALLQLLTIYFTASRAVILALLCGTVLFFLLYVVLGDLQPYRQRPFRRWAIVLTIVLILLPIAYLGVRRSDVVLRMRESHFVQADPLLSRFSSLTREDPSARARLRVWATLWKGFRERPLLGWGQENVVLVVGKYHDPALFSLGDLWYDRAHNIILDWLINAGIFGVLAYLSLFACAFYLLWRLDKRKPLRALELVTLFVLLVAYFVQNLFQFDSLMSYVMFFAILAFLGSMESQAGRTGSGGDKGSPSFDEPATKRSYGVLLGASAFVIFVAYSVNVRPYLQARSIGATLHLFKTGNLDLVIENFDHALSYHTFGDTDARAWIFYLANKLYHDPRAPLAVKTRIVQYAIQEFEKEVKASPLDARPQRLLATLYTYQQELNVQK